MKGKKNFDVATVVAMKPESSDGSQNKSTWLATDLEAQTLTGLSCSSPIAMKISRCTTSYSMLSKL